MGFSSRVRLALSRAPRRSLRQLGGFIAFDEFEPPTLVGFESAAVRDRRDGIWVARRASKLGVVCVHWQQVCLGVAAAGRNIDVWVTDEVMQFFDGDQLLRTEQGQHPGDIRKKRASVPGGRAKL